MMDSRMQKKVGAVSPAPALDPTQGSSPSAMAIPARYSKDQRFHCDGHVLRFRHGRAYMLDLLIAAKPAGVDRSQTWAWCANICDTISAIRAKGLDIPRPIGGVYVLHSDVQRIGGAA